MFVLFIFERLLRLLRLNRAAKNDGVEKTTTGKIKIIRVVNDGKYYVRAMLTKSEIIGYPLGYSVPDVARIK